MSTAEQARRYTYDDLATFPDDHLRRELIDGELIVTPAPRTRHQQVVSFLVLELGLWTRSHGGLCLPAPTDVRFTDDTVLEPDVLLVRPERLAVVEELFLSGPPDVVVEVSSPSTRRLELVRKRRVYEREQVPEYWYVDLDGDRVEVYRMAGRGYPMPALLGPGDQLTSPLLEGFAVAVADLLCLPAA